VAAAITGWAAFCRVTHSWSAFCAAASSADTVGLADVLAEAVVEVVDVVEVELVVTGGAAASFPLLLPVRMRKPKNAAAAMASTATTPRTSGRGDRR
jgi:hypothetical protein